MDDEFRITKQTVEQKVGRVLSGHHRTRAYREIAIKAGCPVYLGMDRIVSPVGVVLSTEKGENGEVIANIFLCPPEHVSLSEDTNAVEDLHAGMVQNPITGEWRWL